jgi:XTP/dITP diphosphohydrolase
LIKRRVVVATGNPGKVREIDAILSDPEIELLSLSGLPAVDFPEEGGDYAANAIEKARAAATQLSEWAVADDSGLEVDALDGRPGPYSARFGGPGLDDKGRVEALLRELAGVEGAARSARFVCIAALATPSGETVTRRGECEGTLLLQCRGASGFGYDPIFKPVGEDRTLAELTAVEKNRISHRARAFRALAAAIRGDRSD